jgi:hypothetical protein
MGRFGTVSGAIFFAPHKCVAANFYMLYSAGCAVPHNACNGAGAFRTQANTRHQYAQR